MINCSMIRYKLHEQYTSNNLFKLAKLPVVSERDEILKICVINIWNSLSDNIVAASSISNFNWTIIGFDFSKFLLF